MQCYQRFRNATHASTFAGGKQDRSNVQSRIKPTTLFKQTAHIWDSTAGRC